MRKKDYVELLSKELYHCRRCKKALELIENGATNQYQDANGFTAMYWFCTKADCLPVVKALLSRFPAEIDTTNRWDKTPLFAAYNTNNRLCWQFLVRQKAKRRDLAQLASIDFDKIYKATIRRKFIELDRFLRKKKITTLTDMENPVQFWLQNHRLLGSDYLDTISKSSPEALKTLDKHLKCSDTLIDGLQNPIVWWIRQEGSLGLEVLEKIRKRKNFDEILQKDVATIVSEGLNDLFVVNGLLELIKFFENEDNAPQENLDSGVIDPDGHLQIIFSELQHLQRPLFVWSTKAAIIGPAGLQLLSKSFDFEDLLKNELSTILEEMSEEHIFGLNLIQRYCSDNDIELKVALPKDILDKWMNVKDEDNFLLEMIIDSADSVEILLRSLFDIICDHEDFEELYPKLDKLGTYLQLKEFEFANPIRWWVLEEGKAGGELLTALIKKDFEEVIVEDFAMMAYFKEFALYDSAKVGVLSLASYALSKNLAQSANKGFAKILPSPLQWWSELPFGDFIGSVRLLKSSEKVSIVMEDMEDYQLEKNPIFTNGNQFLDVLFSDFCGSPITSVLLELSKIEKKYQRQICDYINQSERKFSKCDHSLVFWLLLSDKFCPDVLELFYGGVDQITSVLRELHELKLLDSELTDGLYQLMIAKEDDFKTVFSKIENPLLLWFTHGKSSPEKSMKIFMNTVENPEESICQEIKALRDSYVLNNYSEEITLFVKILMLFPEHSHLAKIIIDNLGNPLIWWYKFSNDEDFVDTISKMDDFVDYFKDFLLENFPEPEKAYLAISSGF
ncbi:Oidioi.mRNA.OKI2018_I69.chr2.g6795.t2.cds [Oikopleura dioica]|uniref:Oidioi.mRNA.OKI2018_I69.chr2.g6795.t2.cds n=1 Tax=Oikopleura dioica TaxID=34765 RepID=A0ABN7T8Y6_OIKDI|nr:Oidioi.mRNA.OKI2018_I69.chr2.g6795.t2.cds [Oikopleura dioica]